MNEKIAKFAPPLEAWMQVASRSESASFFVFLNVIQQLHDGSEGPARMKRAFEDFSHSLLS
jgi:hypothetical protein